MTASIPTTSLCPVANGQRISAGSSSQYNVTCSSDCSQGAYASVGATSSYLDCVGLCDADAANGCLGFVYVGGEGGLGGGICWLKSGVGSYVPAGTNHVTGYKGESGVFLLWTMLIKAGLPSVSCPQSNGTSYTAANGDIFLIECGIDHAGGDIGSIHVSNLMGCIEACAGTAGCVDVSLSGAACYMKGAVGYSVANGVSGARLISGVMLPKGFGPVSCVVDSGNPRPLPFQAYSSSSNTPSQCATACSNQGYKYAGTEYGTECWCGDYLPSTRSAVSTDCSMQCSGDSMQTCGGPNRLSVTASASQQALVARQSYNTWQLEGCYSDSAANRTLSTPLNVAAGAGGMTEERCLDACTAKGFAFCGVEFGQECFGANNTPDATRNLGGDPLAQGCDYPCAGNRTEACGGANRVLVYAVASAVS
ncbi:hypothetical protein ANO11243_032850 [Dothideomycetidae sp. 11243]|nr:hypothetical protein ANO11243_032850 [fungal sp. No.11243]